MRTLGRWVGKARAHARHFTSGIENMMREAELEEMEKRWREENKRIMREHPMSALPYAGAGTGPGDPPQASSAQAPDDLAPYGQASGSTLPDDGEPRRTTPGLQDESSLPDEPTLPLPQPDHHRRELP
jgi:sec-independent protein translocase protein TatB